jgi:hypothetical protein
MTESGESGEGRLRPLVFLSHNPISLTGIGLTAASALTLIGFWVCCRLWPWRICKSIPWNYLRPLSAGAVCPGTMPHSTRYLVEEAKAEGDGAASDGIPRS